MNQLKRDVIFALIIVAACAAMIEWIPGAARTACDSPVQELFWDCVR
jgi:hypothetical protein